MTVFFSLASVAILLGLVGCSGGLDSTKDTSDIRAVLDRYVQSVVNEDIQQYAEQVRHDAEMVNFGAFGAPILGWEGLRVVMEGQNAGLDSIQIDQSDVRIHIAGERGSAWATSLWRFRAKAGENLIDLPVRCTWVLEKRAGVWQVVHFHKSVSAG